MGPPIAIGRTAEIYDWKTGQILKLFFDWFGLDDIRYEQRLARAVHSSGPSVPAVGEIIRVNGRNGLLYQRAVGVPMWELMARKPWHMIRYARQMVDPHFEVHASTVQADLPRQHQRLADNIRAAKALPADLRLSTLAQLAAMPEGDRICHGDFHPGNIIITEQGAVVVDWIDASLGNPLAGLARTTILLQGAVATDQIPNPWSRIMIRLLHALYVRGYFSIRPGGEREYTRWLPIVAAARLSESIPELEACLVARSERASEPAGVPNPGKPICSGEFARQVLAKCQRQPGE